MAVIWFFVLLLVLSIIQFTRRVGHELDGPTHGRIRWRVQQLSQGTTPLLQEQEQRSQLQKVVEQSGFAEGAPLFAALQQWQFWMVAGVLLLLFGLCWWHKERIHEPASSGEEESSSTDTEEEEEEEEEEEQEEEEVLEEEEIEGEDVDDYERCLFRIFAKRVQWSVQSLAYRSRVVQKLVGDLLNVFQDRLSNTFFPVLQPAIGVGSAFEGWNPHKDDAVYRLLVPLKPPRGHTFHLELGTAGEMPTKFSCIHVELECTCISDQPGENKLCFLHHPEEELRGRQGASLLRTLCTGSYLDTQKTAQWFQQLVTSAWGDMPQSRHYNMKVLPSSRSCKLQLTNASGRTLFIELVFGVQQGDSDIFLTSEPTEVAISIPSTTWPESYAVAEVKFFRHMARQVPLDTFHLKCLQLCAHIVMGTGFSTYTLKTVVMHLLNTLPLSSWSRREFLMRLQDIMCYLHGCLEEKHLDHFLFGNENMPEDIILPPDFQTAEPLNLFQHLVQDSAAHTKALREFNKLQNQLTRQLFYGY